MGADQVGTLTTVHATYERNMLADQVETLTTVHATNERNMLADQVETLTTHECYKPVLDAYETCKPIRRKH